MMTAYGDLEYLDIFSPQGDAPSDYHHIYPIAIDPDGTITSNTTFGASGWNFSDNSRTDSLGYNGRTFSYDDGLWGFRIPGYF